MLSINFFKNILMLMKYTSHLKNKVKQKNLEVYFKKYLYTDISQLKRLWLIPERQYEDNI